MSSKVTLEAPDISCDHCIASIRKAVTAIPGVDFISGDPESKQVVIEYNPESVTLESVKKAMEEEGYPVKK